MRAGARAVFFGALMASVDVFLWLEMFRQTKDEVKCALAFLAVLVSCLAFLAVLCGMLELADYIIDKREAKNE